MKKIIFSLVALMTIQLSANAQTVITNNYDSPITSADGTVPSQNVSSTGFRQGSDLGITFNTDQKVYGLTFLSDVSDAVYFGFGYNMGFGDYSSYLGTLQLGVGKRYVIDDTFLIQGKIGAYAGYHSYEYGSYDYDKRKSSTETKAEFTYGANVSICAGLKLWNTKKGNSTFVTVGYYMTAPEFKTDNMGDNGSWGIGFTTIINN